MKNNEKKIFNGYRWVYRMGPLLSDIKKWNYGDLIQYRDNYNILEEKVCYLEDVKSEIQRRKEECKRFPISKKLR